VRVDCVALVYFNFESDCMKCRKYDKECDLWSIGVVTYVLLCGYPPFYGDTDAEIFASVKRGEFDFPSPDWDDISTQAKHFIRACLKVDASKRPTARVSAQTFCCACGAIINDGM
jgi:calcium/calmodulin-dependent protein kinase I